MADLDEKERRFKRRKRNQIARTLYENKGAFAVKPHNPKKQEYKRVKLNPKNIDAFEEDGDYE